MEKFRAKFVEEAGDLIDELEKVLLSLDTDNNDPEQVQQVFRVMHSLKGGSAMFGFTKMDKFTHHLENIYDLIRNNKLNLSVEILDVTLASVDHLRNLAKESNDSDDTNQEQHELLLARILSIIEDTDKQNSNTIIQTDIAPKSNPSTYYICFEPNADMFKFGTNPLYLIDELCDLGETLVYTKTNKVPQLDKLDSTTSYISWEIFLATSQGINAISEVFIFADDNCTVTVKKLSDINLVKEDAFKGIAKEAIQEDRFIDFDKLKQLSLDLEKVFSPKQSKKTENNTPSIDNSISSIRVSSEKLDNLINWVSELVTIQARLSLYAQDNEIPGILPIAEEVEKITRRLRDDVFSIRLIPIEEMLTRFHRLVRELSNQLDKEVVFKTTGTETELDKNMIELLAEPLMHIVRNSMDHGIESAEEREMLGKDKRAQILLKAYYSGTNVVIEISDDGKGIDPKKIKEKAISQGIISPDSNLNKKEILDLIFEPGFSTAQKVTKVSGRGVGMDVVKRKISEIRGEVDIQSEINVGTTISIRLPLTLSIIDGLLVQISNTKFVIPLSAVFKCYDFKREKLDNAVNNLIRTDEEEIAFLNMRDLYEINGEAPESQHVVVVQYGETKIGLAVDNIIGQYQAVLKPLGKLYKHQQAISGATILGDGSVALVMDTTKLISKFAKQETKIGY